MKNPIECDCCRSSIDECDHCTARFSSRNKGMYVRYLRVCKECYNSVKLIDETHKESCDKDKSKSIHGICQCDDEHRKKFNKLMER